MIVNAGNADRNGPKNANRNVSRKGVYRFLD
jgi:hypothetical protein